MNEEQEAPVAELKFKTKDGSEAILRVSLEFDGDWINMFPEMEDATEQDARDGFSIEFFRQIAQLF